MLNILHTLLIQQNNPEGFNDANVHILAPEHFQELRNRILTYGRAKYVETAPDELEYMGHRLGGFHCFREDEAFVTFGNDYYTDGTWRLKFTIDFLTQW